MSTAIKDFGRHSEQFGEIPFYYAFPFRFWIGSHEVMPEDVLTWCRENCRDDRYYKVVCYTHKNSKTIKGTKEFYEKVIYVDKVYLASAEDAEALKAAFDVRSEKVQRPRFSNRKKKQVKTVHVK